MRLHEAITQNTDGRAFEGVVEDAQEGRVVGGFAKQLETSGGPVQGVIHIAGRGVACGIMRRQPCVGTGSRIIRCVPF